MSEPGYGGFWARFLALLVDSVIVTTAMIALVIASAFMKPGAAAMTALGVLYGVGPFFYWVVMHASERKATFGKALLGMTVTTADGERISLLRSFGRELAKILSAIPLFLGYVIAGFTGRKQALHDFAASTTVIRHEPGRVGLAVFVGVFGWLAPVALVFVVGIGVLATQFRQMTPSIVATAIGGSEDSTATSDTTVQLAAMAAPRDTTASNAPAAAPAGAAGEGVEAAFAARLTGMEEKPGMTQAGPVLLELSTLFQNSFWIKTYLPPLREFQGAEPVVALTSVTDSKGTQMYDPAHSLEKPFFQKVSLSSRTSPVPHLAGNRSVTLKDGAPGAETLQRIEGTVTLAVGSGTSRVERTFPFVLTKTGAPAPVASKVASNAASTVPSNVATKVVSPVAAATEAPRRPRPRPEPAVVSALDAADVAALDQLSPQFATEIALVPARYRDRPVQLYDFGAIARASGAGAPRVYWPIHGFDARGNPVAIRSQRPIFTTLPRLGDYTGVWQLVYVVTADMAQPNYLRDAAAVDAAVRGKRAMLREAGLFKLPIVTRGSTLARDTTRTMLGWYKGRDVEFFDFGAGTPATLQGIVPGTDSAGRGVMVVADSAAEPRLLEFHAVGDSVKARAPSPLRAFSDMRNPMPPKPTHSP